MINKAQSDKRIHFGLADHNTIAELTVNWVSGLKQKIKNVPADKLFQIIEPNQNSDDLVIGSNNDEIIALRARE